MRHLFIGTCAVAALALGGCDHKDDVSNNDAAAAVIDNSEVASNDTFAPAPGTASPAQTFANTAASSDAFEIAMSKLAATNAKSDAVKTFATKMIDAHTGSTAKLKSVAASLSPAITPDPTLTPEQQQKVDSLKSLSGNDFDKAFASAQIDAHQQTLDALKSYAATGNVPQFKNFATDLVPTVTDHLNMAKNLKP